MSAYAGPELTNSGLILAYDMGNTDKSWKGAPATNLCFNGQGVYTSGSAPYAWAQEQSFGGITTTGQTSGTDAYGYGYFQFTVAGTTTFTTRLLIAPIHAGTGLGANVTAGVTYTFSYNVDNVSGYRDGIQGNYLWYDINGTYLSSSYGTLYSSISGWSRKTDTVTAPAGAVKVTTRFDFYGNNIIGTVINFTFRLGGIQWEVGSFATPYIPTTTAAASRTVTQAILDPIGKNTLIANSLSYASNSTFSFNGANSYIETPAIPGTGTSTSSLTWSVWCSPATTGNGDIINMRDVSTGWDMCPIYSTGQRFYGKVWNGPVIAGLSTYNLNQYYYLTVVYDNAITDKIKFYINAELQGFNQSSYSASGNTSGNSLYFGRAGNQATLTHFNGKIPAAAIYTKALSANEVKQNFNALRGRFGI